MCLACGKFERVREKNYAVTPYISEFFCTITNVPFIIVGLYNLYYLSPTDFEIMHTLYWLMVFAGIASGIHHAFIFRGSIILDWIPIASSILLLVYNFNFKILTFVTFTSWIKFTIALAILLSDHLCTPLKVPIGHCAWHLAACWAVNSMYRDLLIPNLF